MSTRFDAIVIGTGQSGPSLAAEMSGRGMKVAIIDYNAGNVQSVIYALNRLGIEPLLTNNKEEETRTTTSTRSSAAWREDHIIRAEALSCPFEFIFADTLNRS